MKTNLKLLAVTAIVAIIGFLIVACDGGDDGNRGGGTEGSFSMPGYTLGYNYTFRNYSDYTVTVTINGVMQTMPPYAKNTGLSYSVTYPTSLSGVYVKYTPANKVRYEASGALAEFYDR